MIQDYHLDNSYIYYGVGFTSVQSVINENVINVDTPVVLTSYLTTINSQLSNYVTVCSLPKGIKPRTVTVLLPDDTAYKFDIPFNSSSPLWLTLLNELTNDLTSGNIKQWDITGEKIPGYKLPLLLTKVP